MPRGTVALSGKPLPRGTSPGLAGCGEPASQGRSLCFPLAVVLAWKVVQTPYFSPGMPHLHLTPQPALAPLLPRERVSALRGVGMCWVPLGMVAVKEPVSLCCGSSSCQEQMGFTHSRFLWLPGVRCCWTDSLVCALSRWNGAVGPSLFSPACHFTSLM